ncbi:hypothetical protein A2U01_0099569, partial [Trifolium medium]|nr:hypothetical protein [Trifolium medium]
GGFRGDLDVGLLNCDDGNTSGGVASSGGFGGARSLGSRIDDKTFFGGDCTSGGLGVVVSVVMAATGSVVKEEA